jgi:hypothetical protein
MTSASTQPSPQTLAMLKALQAAVTKALVDILPCLKAGEDVN